MNNNLVVYIVPALIALGVKKKDIYKTYQKFVDMHAAKDFPPSPQEFFEQLEEAIKAAK